MFLFCLFFFLFFLGSSDSEDKKKEKENARPADRSTQVRSREERDDGGGGGGGDGGGKKRTRGKTIDWRKGVELKALLTVQSSGYSRRPRRHLGASSRLLLPPWLRSIYLSLSLSLSLTHTHTHTHTHTLFFIRICYFFAVPRLPFSYLRRPYFIAESVRTSSSSRKPKKRVLPSFFLYILLGFTPFQHTKKNLILDGDRRYR